MSLILKETGEDIEFKLFDPQTKLDYSVSWLRSAGAYAAAGWVEASDGGWVINKEQYDWWTKIVNTEQEAVDLICANNHLLTKGVMARLKLARSKDIKKFTDARLAIIKDVIAKEDARLESIKKVVEKEAIRQSKYQ